MNYYKCKYCNQTVQRDSTKQWIKSYCDRTGKNARLTLVKPKTK